MLEKFKEKLRGWRWINTMLDREIFTIEELKRAQRFYSQFGEDVYLETYFRGREPGFYVDVGAFNPLRFSNTHLLYKKGWRGINIEPNPQTYPAFPQYRPRDINLNVAISAEQGVLPFCVDGPWSGLRTADHLYANRNPDAETVNVLTFPLRDLLAEHMDAGQKIDLLSVDCEGHDLSVLQSNDWERFRPEVILVEQHGDSIYGPLTEFLRSQNYAFASKLGLTLVFLDAAIAKPYVLTIPPSQPES